MKKSVMLFNMIVKAKQETTLRVESLYGDKLRPTMFSFPSDADARPFTVVSFKIGDEEFLTSKIETVPGTSHHITNAVPSASRFYVTVKNDADEDQRFRMLLIGVLDIDANKQAIDIDQATQRLLDNYLAQALSLEETEYLKHLLAKPVDKDTTHEVFAVKLRLQDRIDHIIMEKRGKK